METLIEIQMDKARHDVKKNSLVNDVERFIRNE